MRFIINMVFYYPNKNYFKNLYIKSQILNFTLDQNPIHYNLNQITYKWKLHNKNVILLKKIHVDVIYTKSNTSNENYHV